MNVRNHQNRATMAYVSIVLVCIIESNIKMELREIGWGGVNFIYLAQDKNQWQAVVNMVMNVWVPYVNS
jgi:5-methylthioribose kinase